MGSRGSGDEGAGGSFNANSTSGKGVEVGGVELQERVEDYDPNANRDLIRTEQFSKDTGLSARSDMGLLGP